MGSIFLLTLTVITHSNTYKLIRNIVTLTYAYIWCVLARSITTPCVPLIVTDITSVRVNINILHISQKYCYIYLSEILLHLHTYSVRTYICTGNNRVVMSKSSVRDFVLVTVYIYMASVRDTITDCSVLSVVWLSEVCYRLCLTSSYRYNSVRATHYISQSCVLVRSIILQTLCH